MNQYGKVALGVRIASGVNPAFFSSWTGLLLKGMDYGDQVLLPSVGRPHSLAANYLAGQFVDTDCDTLLMLDDDMVFTPDTLRRLRQSEPAPDVLSAACVSRRAPFGMVALRRQLGGTYAWVRGGSGVVSVDICGGAFTLIRRHLIEAAFDRREDHQPFHFSNSKGEDGDFCVWCAENCGAKMGVNYDVSIGHRTEFTASWNMAKDAPQMDYEPFGFASMSATLSEQVTQTAAPSAISAAITDAMPDESKGK